MSEFHYFASSLPFLRLGTESPMRSEEFLDQAQYHLPPGQWQSLSAIALTPREDAAGATETRWNRFETCLRNAVARCRARKLKKEAHAYTRLEEDAFGHLESQVQEAFGRDPLNMEEHLDLIRWQFLDDLAVGHLFDYDALVIYRIRLLLLEKRGGLDPENGQARLDDLMTEKLNAKHLPEFVHG